MEFCASNHLRQSPHVGGRSPLGPLRQTAPIKAKRCEARGENFIQELKFQNDIHRI
jgi:hypothetical protein